MTNIEYHYYYDLYKVVKVLMFISGFITVAGIWVLLVKYLMEGYVYKRYRMVIVVILLVFIINILLPSISLVDKMLRSRVIGKIELDSSC